MFVVKKKGRDHRPKEELEGRSLKMNPETLTGNTISPFRIPTKLGNVYCQNSYQLSTECAQILENSKLRIIGLTG